MDNSENITKLEKKPLFLKFRSSNTYVLVTVSMSVFTDLLVYSIIIPIVPFSIDAIHNGKTPDSVVDPYHSEITNSKEVSRDTGILLALFAVGLVIGSPLLGYIADRIKHRQMPMLVGIAGLLGATLLFLFATQFWQLLLARFLQGFSDACVWTLGMCLMADTFPIEELGAQMGKVLVFHSVGFVAGSPIGALYQYGGYKAPFIFCLGLAAIDFILRVFLVERRNRPVEWFEDKTDISTVAPSEVAHKTDTVKEGKKTKVSFKQLLRRKRLIASLVLAFANGMATSVFEPTVPILLSSEWGYNSTQIGLVFLAQVVPTFIASPLCGIISDRYGPKVVSFTALLLCAINMFFIGIPRSNTAGGIVPFIILFSIQGFTSFAFVVPVLSEMAHVVKEENPEGGDSGQATSYALFNLAFAIGGVIGPVAAGYLFSAVGFFYMCIIFGGFLLLCCPYVYVYAGPKGKFIMRTADISRANNNTCIDDKSDGSTRCDNLSTVEIASKEIM